ncbi:MAG TPA: hypothetical protein VLT61_17445 [Anaeromyxobacteraceae bacterium]|nr:hypothetical protein [Anaeromyxobacteraceae bacterium]
MADSIPVSERSNVTTPPSRVARERTTSIARWWRSRIGASGPDAHGAAAISASGRASAIASMMRVGSAGSRVASSSVMIFRAGSASWTAWDGDSNAAASITSAQRRSSSSPSARQPKRASSVRAMKPAQLGAFGSQNFWPLRSPSNAARSSGVGKALAWWSNHQWSFGEGE